VIRIYGSGSRRLIYYHNTGYGCQIRIELDQKGSGSDRWIPKLDMRSGFEYRQYNMVF
jgi:hypothetical protein